MKIKLRILLATIIITALVMAGCNIRPDDIEVDDTDLIPIVLAGYEIPLPNFPNSSVPNTHRARVVDLGDRWYVSADIGFNRRIGESGVAAGTIRYRMVIAKDRMVFFAANEETLRVTVSIAGISRTNPQSIGGMNFWEYFNSQLQSTKDGIAGQPDGSVMLSTSSFMNDVAPQTNRSLAGAYGNPDGQRNREILDRLGISLNLMIPITLTNQFGATVHIENSIAWPGWSDGKMPNFGWGSDWVEARP